MNVADISLLDQIAAVRREIGLRERVYPRWVAGNKMPQSKADREIATMKAVLETLLALHAAAVPDLFGDSASDPLSPTERP